MLTIKCKILHLCSKYLKNNYCNIFILFFCASAELYLSSRFEILLLQQDKTYPESCFLYLFLSALLFCRRWFSGRRDGMEQQAFCICGFSTSTIISRKAAKKSFFSGPAIKAITPPPPSSLVAKGTSFYSLKIAGNKFCQKILHKNF